MWAVLTAGLFRLLVVVGCCGFGYFVARWLILFVVACVIGVIGVDCAAFYLLFWLV